MSHPSRERISFTLSDIQRQGHLQQRQLQQQQQLPPQNEALTEYRRQAPVDEYATAMAVQTQVLDNPPRYVAPPPSLPRSRGPTCCAWSLACIGCLGCLVFFAVLAIEIPWITLEGGRTLLERRRRHVIARRPEVGQLLGSVRLGLWDEKLTMTPLQLTVALSMATSIDESEIHVTVLSNHFFDVSVQGDESLVTQLDAPEFLTALNEQAALFGGVLVVSHSAALHEEGNSTARSSTHR